MAKPPHVKIVFEGNVGGSTDPLEFWSFSLGANYPFDPANPSLGLTPVELDGVALACRNAYATHIVPEMYSDVWMTRVTVAAIDGAGQFQTQPDGAYTRGEWLGTAAGNTTPVGLPLQTALCVTLDTPRPGPTGRGRFFLPAPARAIESATKMYSAASATALATASAAFINAINGALDGVHLESRTSVISSKGYSSPVTGVRVGRAPDTMRSRRRNLDEGYVTAAL